MAEKGFAEDRMGQKIDRCFSDAIIKAGTCVASKPRTFVTSEIDLDFHEIIIFSFSQALDWLSAEFSACSSSNDECGRCMEELSSVSA